MKRNILVVDDDPQIRLLITKMLEQGGFLVRAIADGYTAVEELKRFPYDLIILDIMMPLMNGFTTLRNIQSDDNYKKQPIIMLTSSESKEDVIKAKRMGVDDYIMKPPKREDLLSRVENLLGGRPQFEEVSLAEDAAEALATLEYGLKVKSVSSVGLVALSPVEVGPEASYSLANFAVLTILGISSDKVEWAGCQKVEGGYELYFSFISFSEAEIEKVRDWVVTRTFKKKNRTV